MLDTRSLLAWTHRSLFGIFVVSIFLASTCFAQPAITLSVFSGPPGTKLFVSGSGFDPNANVNIYFDRMQLAVAITDQSGSFSQVPIQVPGSATPGGHWVTGVEQGSRLAARNRFTVNTNWPQFHFLANRAGFNPYENVLNAGNVSQLQLRWSSQLLVFSVGVTEWQGILYVGSQDGNIYALDSSTGATVWNYTTGNAVRSTPAVVNGTLYAGSYDDNLYALDARTGALIWKFQAASAVDTSPAVLNGMVYFGSDDYYNSHTANVYALDAASGSMLWTYKVPSSNNYVSSPTVANGKVYFGSFDQSIYALDASNGTLVWKVETGYYAQAAPAVVNGVVYVGSDALYALDANSGTRLWSFQQTNNAGTPAVANGFVYESTYDGAFYVLDANTGRVYWLFSTLQPAYASPAVANGVAYFGSNIGYAYAFDIKTGAQLWTYPIDLISDHSPTVVNGGVYLSSYFGTLYAFGLPAGDGNTNAEPPDPLSLVPNMVTTPSSPAGRSNE